MFLLLIPFTDFNAKLRINWAWTKDSQSICRRKRQAGWFFSSCSKTKEMEKKPTLNDLELMENALKKFESEERTWLFSDNLRLQVCFIYSINVSEKPLFQPFYRTKWDKSSLIPLSNLMICVNATLLCRNSLLEVLLRVTNERYRTPKPTVQNGIFLSLVFYFLENNFIEESSRPKRPIWGGEKHGWKKPFRFESGSRG